MDNIRVMSEVVNFIQGSKKNYDSPTMQGGVYFSKDSKEILLNGESYGNAVPADEEDLTSVNGVLQLKDREINDDNFQFKGYVILRKNIVEGKNILTQEMINEPNTIYEVRYDFDLDDKVISLQPGSILKYNGGSIENGICKYNNSLGHIIIKAQDAGFKKGEDIKIATYNGILFQNLIHNGIGIDFENEEYNLHFSKKESFEHLHIQNGILNISHNFDFYAIFYPTPNNRNGYINIINITLKSTAKDECVLIYDESTVNTYYNCFSIKNCTFDKVSFLRFNLKDSNPADINSRCGASSIIIENNNILNIAREFISLGNAFYTKAIIRSNYIKNARRGVFYFGVNNDYTLFNNKENGILLFEYNRHINDDDFLCASNIRSYICSLLSDNIGFQYYDTDLKKYIVWDSTAWVNLDNTDLDTPTNEWTTIE